MPFARGHTSSKWQIWEWTPRFSDTKTVFLAALLLSPETRPASPPYSRGAMQLPACGRRALRVTPLPSASAGDDHARIPEEAVRWEATAGLPLRPLPLHLRGFENLSESGAF